MDAASLEKRERLARDNLGLVVDFLKRCVPRRVALVIGGDDEVFSFLLPAYVMAIDDWMRHRDGGGTRRLSTFVSNRCRWEMIRHWRRFMVIYVPADGKKEAAESLRVKRVARQVRVFRFDEIPRDSDLLEAALARDRNVEFTDHLSDRKQLEALLDKLDVRSAYIIKRRFGVLGCNQAGLTALAEELKITKERVRQIENRALRYLRRLVELYDDDPKLLYCEGRLRFVEPFWLRQQFSSQYSSPSPLPCEKNHGE